MSDQPDYLLVDIGNSRIKYALVKAGQTEFQVHSCVHVGDLSSVIQQAQKVLVASVGKIALTDELQSICAQYQRSCQLLNTQAQQFGIRCAYENFATLGVDRWLAILAARLLTDKAVAVIDLGTANTCDIIIGDQHLGGWIAPGFTMMKQALISNTQKVFADQQMAQQLSLGRSTPNCVNMGCLAALQGFVAMADQYLANHSKDYQILVTGGDQGLVSAINHPDLNYFPNLVLVGLSRFL